LFHITEKLIDAYAGGCVPIYSGDVSVVKDFNHGAFLNYQSNKDMSYFTQKIKRTDEAIEIYKTIYQEPLLLKEPKLDNAIQFVRSIVK
jgi:hypothetical protein